MLNNLNTLTKSALYFFVFSILLSSLSLSAQTSTGSAKNKNPFPVKYISEADQKLNIKTITLAPVYDNVNRVYAEPIQKLLVGLLQNDKVWGYSEFPDTKQKIFVETYNTNPQEVLKILEQTKSQGLLTAIITKGPKGLNAKLSLFTIDQGLLLAEEDFQDTAGFEIQKLREAIVSLYHELKNKLPYRALILSRRGLDLTINAGEKNGLSTGQELTIAQILKINRHPKLKYMVGTEKEIIGKVRITKTEPYLSFAELIFEKENGVVEVGAKILPIPGFQYPKPVINNAGEVIDDQVAGEATSEVIEQKKLNSVDNSSPIEKKEFGKAYLLGGIGQFNESVGLPLGTAIDVAQSFSPSIFLSAEAWLRDNWFVDIGWFQSFFKADNSSSSSSPSSINYSYAKYTLTAGRTFFLTDDFWGPKINTHIGYGIYKTDASGGDALSFTNTMTSGLLAKVSGSIGLDPDYPIEIGGSYQILLTPSYSESPASASSSSARATTLGLFGTYRSTPLLKYRFELNFDQTKVDLSGSGRQSTDIKMTSQLFGIEYLF